MSAVDLKETRGMLAYIDASPSPYHACEEAARLLLGAGFAELAEVDAWDATAGGYFVRQSGGLVGWFLPPDTPPTAGFRVIGAHTDSPNLRIKPQPDTVTAGVRQLGVEIYGGVLLNTWLDRDLGLSGRVFLRGERGAEPRLFKIDRPLLRVPQLAIHLDREVNTNGLKLNKQKHLAPVWAIEDEGPESFVALLAAELDVEPDAILSWDAMCHDVAGGKIFGALDAFVSSARLDNQCSCYAALRAILNTAESSEPGPNVAVISLFDHEEVGSTSATGANGPLLARLLERTVLARNGSREDYHRAIASSVCASADMAHATHPNYVDKHEPGHHLFMNQGPVIKINTNQRYATEGATEAAFQLACERADVPVQKFVNRSDLACGSTIGPATAARLGIQTVDVGIPQLAMHSAREMCGARDPELYVRALTAFLG